MSTWAHRVNKIEYAAPSFDIFNERALVDMLCNFDGEEFLEERLLSGCGMVDVPVKALKKVLRSSAKLGLSEQTIRLLQKDISFAESNNQDTVLYDCF